MAPIVAPDLDPPPHPEHPASAALLNEHRNRTVGRPIADILEKLGAEQEGDGWLLAGDALGIASVFGEAVGPCRVTLFSEQAFGFAEPPEMAALGVLWVANVERPEDLKGAVRDAHGRLRSRLKEHEAAMATGGFEARLAPPEPEVTGRTTAGGYDVGLAINANGDLEVRNVAGRPVPARSRLALEDAGNASKEALKEAVLDVVRKLKDAGLLTGRGVFDAPTVRALLDASSSELDDDAPFPSPPAAAAGEDGAGEEAASANADPGGNAAPASEASEDKADAAASGAESGSAAPAELSTSSEEVSGVRRAPRPRRRSRRSREGDAALSVASQEAAAEADDEPAVDAPMASAEAGDLESLLPAPDAVVERVEGNSIDVSLGADDSAEDDPRSSAEQRPEGAEASEAPGDPAPDEEAADAAAPAGEGGDEAEEGGAAANEAPSEDAASSAAADNAAADDDNAAAANAAAAAAADDDDDNDEAATDADSDEGKAGDDADDDAIDESAAEAASDPDADDQADDEEVWGADDDELDWEEDATRQVGPEELAAAAALAARNPKSSEDEAGNAEIPSAESVSSKDPSDLSAEDNADDNAEDRVRSATADLRPPAGEATLLKQGPRVPDVTLQGGPPDDLVQSDDSSGGRDGPSSSSEAPSAPARGSSEEEAVDDPAAGQEVTVQRSGMASDAWSDDGSYDLSEEGDLSSDLSLESEASEDELLAALEDFSSEEESVDDAPAAAGKVEAASEEGGSQEVSDSQVMSLPSASAEPLDDSVRPTGPIPVRARPDEASVEAERPETSDGDGQAQGSTGEPSDPWRSGVGSGLPSEHVAPFKDSSSGPQPAPPPEMAVATGPVTPLPTPSAEHTYQALADVIGDGLRTGKTGAFVLDAEAFEQLRGAGTAREMQDLEEEEAALEARLADVRARLVMLRASQAQAERAEANNAAAPRRSLAKKMARLRSQKSGEGAFVDAEVSATGPGEDDFQASSISIDDAFDIDDPYTRPVSIAGEATSPRPPERPLPTAATPTAVASKSFKPPPAAPAEEEVFADGGRVEDLAAELGADATLMVVSPLGADDLDAPSDDGGGVFDSPSSSSASARSVAPDLDGEEEEEDLNPDGATRVALSPLLSDDEEAPAAPESPPSVGLVVQDTRALARLRKHLGPQIPGLVEIGGLDAVCDRDDLEAMAALVFVRPRRDSKTLDTLVALSTLTPAPKTLVLSTDDGFEEAEGVHLRLPLAKRVADVAQQVVDGLGELGVR